MYIGSIETVHINNQTILQFVNICAKEFLVNISYPSTVDQIYGYLDASISTTHVTYIISRDKGVKNKNNKSSKIQGGDIIRILK